MELQGKDCQQHQTHPEVRGRGKKHGRHRADVVQRRILFHCGDYAQHHAHNGTEQRREQRQLQRHRETAGDLVNDRIPVGVGLTEVKVQDDVFQIIPQLHKEGLINAQLMVQLIYRLLCCLLT